jgi:mono/diheme cytochrome c family protein
MMYVRDEGEIREWILDGHPKRLADEFAAERPRHALPVAMPAYRGVIDDDELDDIVAYYKAVARFTEMPRDVRAGHDVASRLGCFGCHGAGGLVGATNPRSLKGYIPPWRGADFRDLVRSDDELRQWIRDGGIDRLTGNPAARWFVHRQVIAMPAFRDTIDDNELDALVTYIHWLGQTESR